MTKDTFFNLPDDKRQSFVSEALCNLIILEDQAPVLSRQLFSSDNIDVIKIILNAYLNGKISENLKEQ